jgi:hypothetical protein
VSQKVINWLLLSACGGMGVAVIGYQLNDIELLTLGVAAAVVSTVTLVVYVFSRW